MVEWLRSLTLQEVGTCVLYLPFLFTIEMSAADSLYDAKLITLKTQDWLVAVSVFKIPIVGFLTLFLPPVGFLLFVVTTIVSIAAMFSGYFAWRKVIKDTKDFT